MSYLFVINPTAGHRKALKIKEILVKKIFNDKKYRDFNVDFIVPPTVYELENTLRKKIENNSISTVVAVGGDGTIAQVVRNVFKFPNINIGVIPQGTGNILASNLGIPNEVDFALKTVFNGKEEHMDLGQVDGHPFTIIAGVGVPAEIIRGMKKREKEIFGIWAYFLKGLEHIYSAKEFAFRLTIDGKEIETKSIAIFVMNAGNFLGPLPTLTPEAKHHDGYLDVCIASIKSLKEDPVGYFELLINYLTRNLTNEGAIQSYKAKDIIIESTPHLKVQADGDIVSTTPTKISILPKKLKVLVPSKPKSIPPSITGVEEKIEEIFNIKLPG